MPKILYADCLGLSVVIQRSGLLKCVSQPKIAKKSIKTPILAFKVSQGHWIQWQSRASLRLCISD